MTPDHYFRYDELTDTLRGFARRWPALCALTSIGQTREGREIWCLTVCNPATGPADSKPAFYMDGNLHSGEVASSMAVLYTLDRWLNAYGRDPVITALLDHSTVYAIPRINADAAEVVLTTPRSLRGSTEPYYPGEAGIQPCDLDGDGEIRQMRITDPAGRWKASAQDPRVMIERAPDDTEGPFYTLVSEGLFEGTPADFAALRDARPREDLDPNRQFPFEWNKEYPDPARPTSGPAPLHDAEVRAAHDFVCAHPNIVFHMNFHTYGGLHISPAAFCPHLTAPDADAMRALGQAMRRQTGYRCEGIFPEGAKDIAPGSFTTWEYFEKGVMAYVTELWDFHRQADPDRPESWSMFFSESEAQTLREATTAMDWDARNNAGRGFKPWTPFDHPQWRDQDGVTVEIGGWADRFCRQNPPPHLLAGVCEKACDAALVGLKALPRLQVARVSRTAAAGAPDGETVWVTLANTGYLPTAGTRQAAALDIGAELTVTLSGGAVTGENPVRIPMIEGYARQAVAFTLSGARAADLTLTVQGPRCGRITMTIPRVGAETAQKESDP